jgi:Family of unknown function (DUF6353)
LKLEETLEKTRVDLQRVKTAEKKENGGEYTDKERSQDMSVVYVRGAYNVVKLYAPAIVVGGLSIAALTQSQNILTKRNAALTAAYAALDKGFREYRARVVDKYGEDQDREFRYGSEKVEIVNEETGRKKTVNRVAPGTPSVYARFFDPLSPSWSKDPETNFIFLHAQQNYANDLLHSRGHIFLNEVYDMLGIPRTKAGQVVGWMMVDNPEKGDNYINFGIFDENDKIIDFVNGREASILLDFNVNGVIYHLIDTPVEARSWQMGN